MTNPGGRGQTDGFNKVDRVKLLKFFLLGKFNSAMGLLTPGQEPV